MKKNEKESLLQIIDVLIDEMGADDFGVYAAGGALRVRDIVEAWMVDEETE